MGEPAETQEPRKIKLKAEWREPQDMEPVFCEHLHLQLVGDKFYWTFGRLELPLADMKGDAPEVEIKPVGVRFVMPIQAMRKVRDLLKRVVKDTEEEE